MQLIGLLDSPYVRRVAVSLLLLGVPFRHRRLSVFRDAEAFRGVNPVLKAPTLRCDDGTVLMDSSLILQYAESLVRPRTLWPHDPAALAHALRRVGLTLAACEKAAQIVYERALRPPEKRHAPWVDRITAQLLAACEAVEAGLVEAPLAAGDAAIGQDTVTAACTWCYLQQAVPLAVAADAHPRWAALSLAAEALPAFAAAPADDGAVVGEP